MCENNEKQPDKVHKSLTASMVNQLAWIPFLGMVFFILLLPFVFISFSKGRLGFKLVLMAFIKAFILSVLPLALLVLWGGLSEDCYPDFIFGKHGIENQSDNGLIKTNYYYFGNLKKIITSYRNLQTKSIENYENDMCNGFYELFYENGQKQCQGTYRNDRYFGTWQGWYENGQQSWIAQYDDNGKQVGKYTVWHEDGKIALEGHFENGVEVGKWTCYKEDGSVDWQTDDYQNSPPQITFSSKYNFDVMKGPFDKLGQTPTDGAVIIPLDAKWHVEPINIKFEKEFIQIIDEMRRKYVCGISFEEIGLNFNDEWLVNIKCFPFSQIILEDAKISDDGLYYLKGQTLDFVLFTDQNITDKGLYYIRNVRIEKLYIFGGTQITDSGLANLKQMSLQNLSLKKINISDAGLLNLKELSLRTLKIRKCPNISPEFQQKYHSPEDIKQMLEEVSKKLNNKKTTSCRFKIINPNNNN